MSTLISVMHTHVRAGHPRAVTVIVPCTGLPQKPWLVLGVQLYYAVSSYVVLTAAIAVKAILRVLNTAVMDNPLQTVFFK